MGLLVAGAALATGILNKPLKPIMSDPVATAVQERKAAFRAKEPVQPPGLAVPDPPQAPAPPPAVSTAIPAPPP